MLCADNWRCSVTHFICSIADACKVKFLLCLALQSAINVSHIPYITGWWLMVRFT